MIVGQRVIHRNGDIGRITKIVNIKKGWVEIQVEGKDVILRTYTCRVADLAQIKDNVVPMKKRFGEVPLRFHSKNKPEKD